jgi:PAS domain S-box-containing protein
VESFSDSKLKVFTQKLVLEKSKAAIGRLEVFLLSKNKIQGRLIAEDELLKKIKASSCLINTDFIILNAKNEIILAKNENSSLKQSVTTPLINKFLVNLKPDAVSVLIGPNNICYAAKTVSSLNVKILISCHYAELTKDVKILNKKIEKLRANTAIIYFSISALVLFLVFFIVIKLVKKATISLKFLCEKAKNINIENLNIEFPSFKIKEINTLSESLEGMIFNLKKTVHDKNSAFEELSNTTMMFASVMSSAIKYGKITLFSRGAETMFGYPKHEAKDKLFTLIADDIKDTEALIEDILKNGVIDIELKGKRKDGSLFPMALSIAARYDELLEHSGLIIITSDKTSENKVNSLRMQHQAQSEQLRDVENIIDSLPIGIFVTDQNGEVLIENEAAREILDFKTGDSALGLGLLNVKSFKASGITKYLSDTITHKKANFLSDVKYKTPAVGKDIYLDINFTPLTNSEQSLTGIIISFVDQTLLTMSITKMKEQDDIIKNSPIIAYKINIRNGENKINYLSENISLLGYKPEDFYYDVISFEELIVSEDLENVLKAKREGTSGIIQYRVHTKMGNIRWVEDRMISGAIKNGKSDYIQGVLLDITDAKLYEEEAREQKKKNEKQLSILKKYVDSDVLDFMMNQSDSGAENLLASELINATVCFIDICGFTAISESSPPDVVVKMLNKYFDIIVQELRARNGYIDKFIGDAIMTVFKEDFHVELAVEASIVIRQRIKELMDQNLGGSIFSPNVSIGINTGDMISGNIGSETIERLDYTVIGDTVNTASRFQSAAKDGQIIISDNILSVVQEFVRVENLGEVNLKNKKHPVNIYNIIDFM